MKESGTVVTLSATGIDSPGLVAKITAKIFELGGNVIDVEENCRRGLFSIFLIIDFSGSESDMAAIEASLSALENETGLRVLVDSHAGSDIKLATTSEHHVVTILGVDQPGIIAKVSAFFKDWNINIENLKMIARGKFFSMEMVIDTSAMEPPAGEPGEGPMDLMKERLKELCAALNQSVVIQSENIYMKSKKLVVFDVESTMLQENTIKTFLSRIKEKLPAKNSSAFHCAAGEQEMDVLVQNALSLKGIPACDFEVITSSLEVNPGALELIKILKSMGFKIALLSSGFNFFMKRLFEKAGVDYAFSNSLKVDESGLLTGELDDPVITADSKDELLEFIMNVEGLSRDQVIAVGDGSTRAHFMRNVGLSIAFKPGDGEVVDSDGIISSDKILNMLYCLGIPKSELDRHLGEE